MLLLVEQGEEVVIARAERPIARLGNWQAAVRRAAITRLLLDTHLVPWWLNADPRLPADVVEQVQALAVAKLESDADHRDRFDRRLVCQSRVEPMLAVTVDQHLQRYGTTVNIVA